MPPTIASGTVTASVDGPRADVHASELRENTQKLPNSQAPESPELKRHRRAIERGNIIDRDWMSDERFDELVALLGIAASHCTSAGEAAWRRDQALTGVHLRHAREGLMLALKTFNILPQDSAHS